MGLANINATGQFVIELYFPFFAIVEKRQYNAQSGHFIARIKVSFVIRGEKAFM